MFPILVATVNDKVIINKTTTYRKDVVMVPSRITEMQQGHDGYKQVQTKFKDFKIWTTHDRRSQRTKRSLSLTGPEAAWMAVRNDHVTFIQFIDALPLILTWSHLPYKDNHPFFSKIVSKNH